MRRRNLEQAAATETEQRVAAKQESVAVECDVAHGMAGDGDGFEGPVADPDPVAVAHPLTGHVDPVVDRRDHRPCRPAADEFVDAADVLAVVVRGPDAHPRQAVVAGPKYRGGPGRGASPR